MLPSDHVDASVLWIVVTLVDQDGKEPEWVRMVARAKGHGDIDIDAARIWLAANPDGCACPWCRSQRVRWGKQLAAALQLRPAQMTLF